MIKSFTKENRWLSNFWPCKIIYECIEYQSTEAAYQAAKTNDIEIKHQIAKMTASEAKRVGKKLKLRPDWENIKLDVMEELVRYKFFNNPELRQKLLDTKNQMLVEGNWWGDKIYGIDMKTGEGLNYLGKILMKVRQELRNA